MFREDNKMAYRQILIMNGKLIQDDADFVLTRENGSAVEPFDYRGMAECQGNYLAFTSGMNIHAFLIGMQTPESAARYAGKLAADNQKIRRIPKRALTDRSFYHGWNDRWKEYKGE